jgi:LuxR family maltose regulon positive regulatory protein
LPIIVQEVQQVNLARVRLAQDRAEEALAIAARYAPEAEAAGRRARVIEFSLVSAVARQRMGDREGARAALSKALALGQPSNYRQIFLEAGAPVGRLLAALPAPQQTAYVRALRQLFSPGSSADAQPLIEPLSARELEVLQLIAAGLSNKQIAAQLVVSLNTVKKHTTHIYGKLGISGRTQAVARARALQLL